MSDFGAPQWMEQYRIQLPGYPLGNKQNGAFMAPNGMRIIISKGGGWEHVSFSRKGRMPTYGDAAWIKKTFWPADATVIQYFVDEKDHVNVHEYCLHLWRPTRKKLPRPPQIFV